MPGWLFAPTSSIVLLKLCPERLHFYFQNLCYYQSYFCSAKWEHPNLVWLERKCLISCISFIYVSRIKVTSMAVGWWIFYCFLHLTYLWGNGIWPGLFHSYHRCKAFFFFKTWHSIAVLPSKGPAFFVSSPTFSVPVLTVHRQGHTE